MSDKEPYCVPEKPSTHYYYHFYSDEDTLNKSSLLPQQLIIDSCSYKMIVGVGNNFTNFYVLEDNEVLQIAELIRHKEAGIKYFDSEDKSLLVSLSKEGLRFLMHTPYSVTSVLVTRPVVIENILEMFDNF